MTAPPPHPSFVASADEECWNIGNDSDEDSELIN